MDTKEIINVNECEFLWKEKLPKRVCNNGNLDCDCNSNPNCYFKQLKRAELKLKEIKEIVVPIKGNTCFGMHCGVIDWILKIIEGKEDEK